MLQNLHHHRRRHHFGNSSYALARRDEIDKECLPSIEALILFISQEINQQKCYREETNAELGEGGSHLWNQ